MEIERKAECAGDFRLINYNSRDANGPETASLLPCNQSTGLFPGGNAPGMPLHC